MTTASAAATPRVAVTGLRPLDPRRDLPEVVQLIEVGFREELDPLGLKMLERLRRQAAYGAWSQLLWGGTLNLEGFVWEERGRVVGNLSLRRAAPGWSGGRIIGNVVVHPDYRGRGIARALMEAAEHTARAEGARWLGLEVRSDNAVARTLYTHLGFQPVGEVAHLLRPGDLPWPDYAAPRSIWRRSRPEDRLLWAGLVEKTLPRLQAQVLEVRPELYLFGSFERKLELWLSHERESAWIQASLEPRLAVSVQSDLKRRFHVWDVWVFPPQDEVGAREAVARALVSVPRQRHWPIITFVNSDTVWVSVLQGLGFVQHRLLTQMYHALA